MNGGDDPIASLTKQQLEALKAAEGELGLSLVAVKPEKAGAIKTEGLATDLTEDQVKKLNEAETRMGLVLLAHPAS